MHDIYFNPTASKISINYETLTDAEVERLLIVLTEYLLNVHNSKIQSRMKQTLATSFTMVFPETQKICTNDIYQHYGVSLGLFVEDSQTAYNIHQRGCKSNS